MIVPATTTARRGLLLARELGLAGLVAGVAWVVLRLNFDEAWTFVDCSAGTGPVWALMAGIVFLALLRLRFPFVALVLAAGLFGVWPVAGSLLALTAFHAAGRATPRRLWVAAGLAVLADLPGALLAAQYGWSIAVVGHAAGLLICVGLPIGVRILLGKADRVVSLLRERTHYLEDNYRLAHSAARLQERSRIAQEMHDQIGHRLTLISLYAGALEMATAGAAPQGAGEARMIRGTVQAAMQELRSTLGMLRSDGPWEAQLQPVEQAGTRTDLRQLVAESRATGVRVELIWRGEDLADASVPVRRAAHRLVREGLTNVHRHSPGADARVVVERGPGRVRIEVVNGRPPQAPAAPTSGSGLGLVGAQERVRLLGGAFRAGATGDGGFRMVAELPLTAQPEVAPSPADPPPGHRALRRTRDDKRGIGAVLTVGLIAVPALVVVLLNAASEVVPGDSPYDTSQEQARIGMSRSDYVAMAGDEDPLTRMAASTVETPVPAGTDCLYSRDWNEENNDMIVRYCFRDGRLAVIDRFPVGG